MVILAFVSMSMYAQSIVVTGKVIDSEGYEVIGGSVTLKGTPGVGTVTNVDGHYSLKVNDVSKDVLVFSYVGMTSKEVKVNGRNVVNVTLEADAVMLDEVVTIGYATVKKKDLTGSVSSVNSKELAAVPISDVTQALSGKVAGVQVIRSQGSPDADVSIKVRGGTSITQSNEPLYIIDGFPSEDGLKGIESSDIESIDILKDASSTAIYGARGANGVILVTTKGGKTDKFNISYDMYVGFKKVNKKYELLGVEDFVKLDYERAINEPDVMRDYTIPTYGTWDEFDGLYGNRKGIDWQKEVFDHRPAITQQHKFTISGGNKTSQYMLTYTRNDDKGIWYGSGLKRDNFRLKLNQEATSWMNFSTNVSYIDEKTEGLGTLQEGGAYSRMQHVIQYRPTIGKNGSDEQLLIDDDDPVLLLEGASQMQSPMATIESEQRDKRNRILSINGDVQIKFTKDLSYRGTVGIRKRTINTDVFYSERSKQAKNAGDERSVFIIKNIFQPVYERYKSALSDSNQIDFTDAILQATEICRTTHLVEYDYIIVDEFQDISVDRYNFLKVLREGNPPAKLYCVGDDWQSIYRFSGSDMALFNQFPEYFGTTEINKIETTYRFGEPLVSLSSRFIQRNNAQIKKDIHSFSSDMKTELEFCSYDRRDYCKTIGELIDSIPLDKSIFLLGRYSFDDYYLSFMYQGIKEGNRFYYVIGGRKIEFLTVHKSKGLEADYVILLQCNKDTYGFPSLVSDDPVLNYVLTKSDQFPYGEERRLFYVAITRAKLKTLVLYDKRFPSVFVDEFLHPEKVSEESYVKHPNANKRWTRRADQFLLELHNEGKSVKYIAAKMGRSQTSIVMRLNKLTQ